MVCVSSVAQGENSVFNYVCSIKYKANLNLRDSSHNNDISVIIYSLCHSKPVQLSYLKKSVLECFIHTIKVSAVFCTGKNITQHISFCVLQRGQKVTQV